MDGGERERLEYVQNDHEWPLEVSSPLLLVPVGFKFGSVKRAQPGRFKKGQLISYGLHFGDEFINGLVRLLYLHGRQSEDDIGRQGLPRFEKVTNFLYSEKSSKLLIDGCN